MHQCRRKLFYNSHHIREGFFNRSYRGKQNRCCNEGDLDNLRNARERMGSKPVVACVRMHNPTVPVEWEQYADSILIYFNTGIPVLMDILFGRRKAGGRLPYNLPESMAAVERHGEDEIRGPEPYRCQDGTVYETGYSTAEGAVKGNEENP